MRKIWQAIRRRPLLGGSALALIAVITAGLGGVTYAYWIQPDPQVFSLAEPVANAGTDATGLTLDEWIKRGNQAKDYRPVPQSQFKVGASFYVLRYDCFVNKTQDGIVSRAYLGGDGNAGTNRTVYTLPDLQIPTRTDGCAVKNHRVPVPPDLLPGTWQYQVAVNFYKNPMQPSIRVLFKPVTITVTR